LIGVDVDKISYFLKIYYSGKEKGPGLKLEAREDEVVYMCTCKYVCK